MRNILTIMLLLAAVMLRAQTQLTSKATVLSGKPEGVELLFDGNTETGWFPGWDASKYPVKVQFDFGEPVVLTKVRWFDAVGKPTLGLTQYNGSVNTPLLNVSLDVYMYWGEREVSTGVKAQYVILTISDIQGDIPLREIQFFGGKDVVVPPSPPPVVLKNLSGDAKKLGMNGFHWIPNDLLILPNMRVYEMSQWTWTVLGLMPNPSYQANANYDTYFAAMKDLGVTAFPCINTVPDWKGVSGMRMCGERYVGDKPIDYKDLAEFSWQYAARYGAKKYPDNLLIVNQTPRWNGDIINEKKSGLNLLKYIEFENEPDRPWNEPLLKYTPEQLAAMMSAIWDGHEGLMGQYAGIKNADPNMKIIMPGLAEINLEYINRMKVWFEANRKDKRFCADVIQVHHYSNSSNPKWPSHSVNLVNGKGVSPEEDQLSYRLKDFNQYVRQNLPKNMEVWYGEFGYDTQLSTNPWICQFPKLYGNHNAEELQSWWLQRIFLIGLSSGMDKLFLFNGIDENSASSGNLFTSSGIMYGQVPSVGSSFGKKPSYIALQALVKNLNGFTFAADKSIEGVTILEFRKGLSKKFFYWSPTASDYKAVFKIGGQSLLAEEFPKTYVPRLVQRKDVSEKAYIIEVVSE